MCWCAAVGWPVNSSAVSQANCICRVLHVLCHRSSWSLKHWEKKGQQRLLGLTCIPGRILWMRGVFFADTQQVTCALYSFVKHWWFSSCSLVKGIVCSLLASSSPESLDSCPRNNPAVFLRIPNNGKRLLRKVVALLPVKFLGHIKQWSISHELEVN